MKNALYLHMGPGFHSAVERQLLAEKYPQIEFWDQPAVKSDKDAYLYLVEAAVKKVEGLNKAAGMVTLYCHSFGGLLARDVLKQVGEKVGHCQLLSTSYYFQDCFINVLKALREDKDTTASLKTEIQKFLSENQPANTLEKFWQSVQVVVKDPFYLRVYWQDHEALQRYIKIAQSSKALDEETFANVANDFLLNYAEPPTPSTYKGGVSLALGDKDPLIDMNREIAAWTKVFPQLQVSIQRNLGHFLHIEKNNLEF